MLNFDADVKETTARHQCENCLTQIATGMSVGTLGTLRSCKRQPPLRRLRGNWDATRDARRILPGTTWSPYFCAQGRAQHTKAFCGDLTRDVCSTTYTLRQTLAGEVAWPRITHTHTRTHTLTHTSLSSLSLSLSCLSLALYLSLTHMSLSLYRSLSLSLYRSLSHTYTHTPVSVLSFSLPLFTPPKPHFFVSTSRTQTPPNFHGNHPCCFS